MLPLLCWEESQRDFVPGEHQSSTRCEEGKEKQVQGLEVRGGLGNGSEEGPDSQEEQRLGERQALAETVSLCSQSSTLSCCRGQRRGSALKRHSSSRLCGLPVFLCNKYFQDKTVRMLCVMVAPCVFVPWLSPSSCPFSELEVTTPC